VTPPGAVAGAVAPGIMTVIAGAACCNPCCCGLTCASGDGCCGDAWYGDNEPFRADAGAARFSDAGCRSAWLASPVPASERWITQRAPAASNFEHKDSAASRLLSSTRMRVQMGSDPGVIAVFKTTGLYIPSSNLCLFCVRGAKMVASV
jgi:hypothetical protein